MVTARWAVVEGTPHPALRATFPLALTPHILWGPLPEGEGGKPNEQRPFLQRNIANLEYRKVPTSSCAV